MNRTETPEERDAFNDGYEDAMEGKSDLANPYNFDTEYALHCAWIAGYTSFEEIED